MFVLEWEDIVLESYVVIDDYLIIVEKKDVLSWMVLCDFKGKKIKEIFVLEVGNVVFVSYNCDVDVIFVGLSIFISFY